MSSTARRPAPFGPGSISLGIHESESEPQARIKNLRDQARAAIGAFDGVTVSEHHAGLDGYVPVPVHLAGWILAAHSRDLWAAPCPVLLPLRHTSLFLEEVAWLAAAFPGRVGFGVAPGWRPEDFEIVQRPVQTRASVFASQLREISEALTSGSAYPLSSDQAIARLPSLAPPALCAVGSKVAARRAGPTGLGIYLTGYAPPETARKLIAEYLASGGTGPRVLIRRVWVGHDAPMASVKEMFADAAQHPWVEGGTSTYIAGSADDVVAQLCSAVRDSDATAVNIRFWMPGLPIGEATRQIGLFGDTVFPSLSQALSSMQGTESPSVPQPDFNPPLAGGPGANKE